VVKMLSMIGSGIGSLLGLGASSIFLSEKISNSGYQKAKDANQIVR